tara:strand:- start:4100 stop:4297 length:198 start_codon:yes stop_codon:yes gene_type:complete
LETKFKIATSFLVTGVLCFLLFYLIGSEVDESGYLHEPFFLLPIGFISIIISMILYVLFAIIKKK